MVLGIKKGKGVWGGNLFGIEIKKNKNNCKEITLNTKSYSRLFYANSSSDPSYSHCLFSSLTPTCDTVGWAKTCDTREGLQHDNWMSEYAQFLDFNARMLVSLVTD